MGKKLINNNRWEKKAIFCYLFFEDLFEESIEHIKNVPADFDIYIATNTSNKVQLIEKYIEVSLKNYNVKLFASSGHGRDVAALLVFFKEYILKYDIICFIHDKKSSHMRYESVGRDFNSHIWSSLLASRTHVEQILNSFYCENHLGLLVPSMVTHGEYFHTAIDFWTICYDGTVKLAKDLGLAVEIDGDQNPLSVGTAFWARTKALKKLFDFNFTYEMFPDEPFPIDGSISHCIERIFPYVAIDAGYYTGIAYSKEVAANSLLNQAYALNQIMRRLDKLEGINTATLKTTLDSLDRLNFTNKAINPVFIDSRFKDKQKELLEEFNGKYNYIHTYRWVRNCLVDSCSSSDLYFLRTFKFQINKRIKTEIALYRYQLVGAMLDAIDDFLEGSNNNANHRYYEINSQPMFDIDRDWHYLCKQIDDCDFLHMLVRKLSFNGYLLSPNRSPILGMNDLKDVQGYRATSITFWDEYTCCGYICKKNVSYAFKTYWRSKKTLLYLSLKYKTMVRMFNKKTSF